MRVFISQPMNGKTDEEIKRNRKVLIDYVENNAYRIAKSFHIADPKVEIIDSYFENAPHDAKPLWFLGKSLELLSTADVAVFGHDWQFARGCWIEHKCCIDYGIPTI